jgi:hypothetical protein
MIPPAGLQFLAALGATVLALSLFLIRGSFRVRAGAAVAAVLGAGALIWLLEQRRVLPASEADVTNRPIRVEESGYVSSDKCRACHPREYATWHGSYHRTMTQVARPQSVIGEFDGRELTAYGHKFRLERVGDEFFVELDDPKPSPGKPTRVRKPIVMTTGYHHMQAYWYATGKARELSLLPFVYLRDDRRWILERASFLKPALSELPDYVGLWNWGCQQCHATAPQPRQTEMDTKVAELGIACEACHGPCKEHVEANRDPTRRYELHASDGADPTIVNPERLAAERASEVCGQCHGIWQAADDIESDRSTESGFTYLPGGELSRSKFAIHRANREAARVRALLVHEPQFLADRYWPDGMVRVSGREFSGLLDTPCFQRAGSAEKKLSCLHCHAMHQPAGDPRPISEWANDQLKPRMDTNEACLECHEELRAQLREHTHHRPESSGSLCYNCHMPYTTYGLLKAIRSHTIDNPSVAATLATGRPNACNQCHLDRTLSWTAERLSEWYGASKPEIGGDEAAIAASVLWVLRGDAGQRALTAWCMGWESAQKASRSDWLILYLATLLADPYDAVRYIAYRSLRTIPGCDKLNYDFLGPEPQRERAVRGASDLWRQHGSRRTTGSQILISENREINLEVWTRLLEERNNQRVHLEE